MKVPDWMRMPLAALGLNAQEVEEYLDQPLDEYASERNPLNGDIAREAVKTLEKLFSANLLNLELQEGPVDEGETMLVRGMLMRVQYVQERRLVLELPPGRRFKRREDGRLIKAAPRKAG